MKKVLSILVLSFMIVAGQASATTIAVNGNNPAQVSQGSVYQDAGATVTYNDGNTAPVAGDTSEVNTRANGTYAVAYTATDTDESGEVATATRTVNVVGGGSSRIFQIPSIVDYSFKKISDNIYEFHFVGKNMDVIRQKAKIKWGTDENTVSFAEWEEYSEVKDIYIPDGQNSITFWVRNSDSTGKILTVSLK